MKTERGILCFFCVYLAFLDIIHSRNKNETSDKTQFGRSQTIGSVNNYGNMWLYIEDIVVEIKP